MRNHSRHRNPKPRSTDWTPCDAVFAKALAHFRIAGACRALAAGGMPNAGQLLASAEDQQRQAWGFLATTFDLPLSNHHPDEPA